MWQALFANLVLRLIFSLCTLVMFPILIVILTPIIFLWAAVVSRRHAQKFKLALADVYGDLWDLFWRFVRAPFSHGM